MYFSKLEYLDFSRNKVKEIVPLYNKYLREVKLYECKIASLNNVFTDKLILLENIEVYSNQI
jgi:Leucine-rich repeat (LRR) protein